MERKVVRRDRLLFYRDLVFSMRLTSFHLDDRKERDTSKHLSNTYFDLQSKRLTTFVTGVSSTVYSGY